MKTLNEVHIKFNNMVLADPTTVDTLELQTITDTVNMELTSDNHLTAYSNMMDSWYSIIDYCSNMTRRSTRGFVRLSDIGVVDRDIVNVATPIHIDREIMRFKNAYHFLTKSYQEQLKSVHDLVPIDLSGCFCGYDNLLVTRTTQGIIIPNSFYYLTVGDIHAR